VVIGGTFNEYDGVPRSHVARLLPDGSLDPSFDPHLGPDGPVFAVAPQSDGRLVIGGMFNMVDGRPRNYLARLNQDGSLDESFVPDLPASMSGIGTLDVRALLVQADERILHSGSIYWLGRRESDGTADLIFARQVQPFNDGGSVNPTFRAYALATDADGKILVGAAFGLRRFHPAGASDTSFTSTANPPFSNDSSEVEAVALLPGGRILIGGRFTAVRGVRRVGLACLEPDGTLTSAFSGVFTNVAVVNALAVTPDGKVILAGMFNVIAGVPCGGIARLNADGTLDPGFHSDLQPETMSGQTPALNALAIRDDGSTVIGGNFSSVSGFPRGAVAQLHGDPPAPPVITTQPVSQTVAEGRGVSLFVSGAYSSATEHQWQLAGTNLPGAIHPALELRDVRQADAGDYTLVLRNASGSVTSEVATLTVTAAAAGVGKTDLDFGRGAGVDGAVACSVATLDGKVIIAGLFRHVHGVPRTFIARLHTDGSLDESFDAGPIQLGLPARYGLGIVAMAADNQGRVYLGGSFTNIQGAMRRGIARLNPSGQLDTTYAAGTGADATVLDLALQPNGTLFIGGEFLSVEGTQRLGIARLDSAGHLDPSFAPVIPITASTVVYALGLQTGGGILASGDLLSLTGGHLVRFKQNGATDTAFTPGISIERAPRALTVEPASGRVYLTMGPIIVAGGLGERILGLNSNGSLIASFRPDGYALGSVRRLALDGCGRLLVGTTSTNVNGLRRTHLARILPDGNLDPEFNPTLDGTVTSILPRPWDDSVFVAGGFSFANGVRRRGFAQLLGEPVSAAAITNEPVGQSIATGQELLLRIGVACPPSPALQWFRNGVAVPGATNTTLRFPNALTTLAGNFVVVVSNIAGVQTSLVATVTVAPPDISPARVDFDFFPGPGPGPDGAVRALALQEDGKLWIGGDFTNVHGIPRQSLARLNRDGSLDLSFDLAALGSFDPTRIPIIYALAVQPDGALLFGGTFMFRRNPRLYYDLVRIGANGELDLAFTPGAAGEPETRSLLVEPDGRIIVGRSIAGCAALRPADGLVDNTFNVSADNSVLSLARTADGQLIGGGAFSSVNSRTR
ncbi:MAG TPA: hypothetical protein VNH84_06510, partial [Candidatus Saccharimonadales bacterium]|nr:hypothetical protein [Candidatus Saccharimonadales bacterium]